LPSGALLDDDEVRASLTEDEFIEANMRDRYKERWAPFGERLWRILLIVENTQSVTKANFMNTFVICAVDDLMADPDGRRKHLMRSINDRTDWKKELLTETGIDIFEIKAGSHAGTLTELKASKLWNKPFQLELTNLPEEHLTLDDEAEFLCIRVIDVATLERFYSAHTTGATKHFPAHLPYLFADK